MKSLRMFRFQWIIALFLPLCLAQTCRPKNILRSRKPENIPRSGEPDLFGIYTSTLDGKNMKPVVTDSYRELNHARISPDKKWITFTRFNNIRKGGLAEEKGGNYLKTEIMLVRTDGTDLVNLTGAPQGGIASCNSYWTPDGKGVMYISNDFLKKKAQISRIDIATRKIIRVPTPENLLASDPHPVSNQIVFPIINRSDKPNSIWIMNADGTNARQLTHPVFPKSAMKLKPKPGD